MTDLKSLTNQLQEISTRNKRVELDKAWETSLTRKLIIAIITYLVIAIFFYFAQVQRPFLNAIVPTVAFILSTTTLPLIKNIWVKRYKKKTYDNLNY